MMMAGFHADVPSTDMNLSPVGTAELSPGRSPGLAAPEKSPVGTTEKVIGTGIRRRIASGYLLQSSLEFLPRTASWAKFSKVQPSLRDSF
jgi:hypothetical protein